MVEKILLPSSLAVSNCLQFCNNLFQTPASNEYEFDFGQMGWLPPFSMLYLSSQINRFRNERSEATFRAKNFDRHTYAAHMGFFKLFGLQHGNAPGEAIGSDTHVPLTTISTTEIKKRAEDTGSFVGEVIEENAHRLAMMLTREDKSDLFVTLRYSIREILRNSVEHSQSDEINLCAQLWPTRGEVEVGICDVGIGIRSSLSNNPFVRMQTDQDALELCILPGVSGTAYKGVSRNHYDSWANSGYGLYMTSRICGEGGNFFLASGDSSLSKNIAGTQFYPQKFFGTAIRMLLKINRVHSLDARLEQLAKEGREIAERINGVDAFGPSIASQIPSSSN